MQGNIPTKCFQQYGAVTLWLGPWNSHWILRVPDGTQVGKWWLRGWPFQHTESSVLPRRSGAEALSVTTIGIERSACFWLEQCSSFQSHRVKTCWLQLVYLMWYNFWDMETWIKYVQVITPWLFSPTGMMVGIRATNYPKQTELFRPVNFYELYTQKDGDWSIKKSMRNFQWMNMQWTETNKQNIETPWNGIIHGNLFARHMQTCEAG